jgi:hypothetical protein
MKDEVVLSIKTEARKYADETLRRPSVQDYLMIENAMLKGARIAIELQTSELKS